MYKIKKNEAGEFDLIELATENLIDSFKEHSVARKMYNAFKGGRGFNGWTPAFFLIKTPKVSTV
jgi:hypothetical protein